MNGTFHSLGAISNRAAVSVILFLFSVVNLQAQELPPVEYDLHVICWPDGSPITGLVPRSISADGKVVGNRNPGDAIMNGYLYEVPNETNPHGKYQELGDLIDVAPLEADGWIESYFLSINDFGAIVGMMEKADGSQRGILVDVSQTTPTWEWLPDMGSYRSYARAINNLGDIAFRVKRADGTDDAYVYNSGMYDPSFAFPATAIGPLLGGFPRNINNMRSVLVSDNNNRYYRYDIITQSLSEILLEREFHLLGFNDLGQACGYFQEVAPSGRGRNRDPGTPRQAIRIGTEPTTQLEWADNVEGADYSKATFINNSGVLVGFRGSPAKGFVLHDDWGAIDLEHLVTSPSWGNLQFTEPELISDATAELNGFGVIIGSGWYDLSTWAYDYVLVPKSLSTHPGVSVSPTSGLTTTEGGGTAEFSVVLDAEPTANVSVGISSSNTAEGIVDKASLTFTPANWSTPQTVTITGVNDADLDGDITYTIVTAAATSTDADYNGLDAEDVSVTNLDDEQAPTVTYDSDVNQNDVDIPDRGTATSTITVPDLYQVADVNVTLTIDHARVQDLDVYLIGPDGTIVHLFTDVGGNGVNFSGTTLDDEAGTSITAGSAPFSGSFYPEGNLGALDGKDTDGDWTLEVTDDKRNRTGTIRNWSITFETN